MKIIKLTSSQRPKRTGIPHHAHHKGKSLNGVDDSTQIAEKLGLMPAPTSVLSLGMPSRDYVLHKIIVF